MAASNKKKDPRSPHPVDVYAGQRLRTRRLLLGMSQGELADRAGITFQQVQKYERGINRISLSRLYELAQILEIPVTYFFDGYNDESKRSNLSGVKGEAFNNDDSEFDLMNRRETIKLVRAYFAIQDPVLRTQVLTMARTLAKHTD